LQGTTTDIMLTYDYDDNSSLFLDFLVLLAMFTFLG